MPEKRRRAYRSRVREESARRTRALIRDTAREMFRDVGYGPTTMKAVAARAGVAERTVYLAYPTKADLLNEVVGVALVGDDEPVPVAQRPGLLATMQASDPRSAAENLAEFVTALLERAGWLLVLAERALDAHPELQPFDQAGAAETVRVYRTVTAWLASMGWLREGVTPAAAADELYVVSHYQVHRLLRVRRRWSRARYQAWLVDRILASIVADGG